MILSDFWDQNFKIQRMTRSKKRTTMSTMAIKARPENFEGDGGVDIKAK